VIFKSPSGECIQVEAEIGCSIMHAALVNGIDGILGECGGGGVCGTCHAYIEAAFADKVPPMGANEDDLLEFAGDRRDDSRLCCQLTMTEELDGVTVRLPVSQP